MLPTYASYYLGGRKSEAPSISSGVFKGLGLGLLITLGFISVFASSGFLISLLGRSLLQYVPWLAIAIGFGLVGLGLLLVTGRSVYLSLPSRLNINPLRKGRGSIYLFGVAYAIASLSCTIPLFLLVVLQALSTGGLVSGFAIFLSYAVGMGVMMTILSVALGASKEALSSYFKKAIPYIGKLSGFIIILAGIYLIYFQVFVGRFFEVVL